MYKSYKRDAIFWQIASSEAGLLLLRATDDHAISILPRLRVMHVEPRYYSHVKSNEKLVEQV